MGSGLSTMPGPPPNGTSSTVRCRSVVKSLRSRTRTSIVPRAIARATTPSASGAPNIAGKIVTTSIRMIRIQLDQARRRIDDDSPLAGIDADADLRNQRNLHFARRALHHQPALLHRPFDADDPSNHAAVRV